MLLDELSQFELSVARRADEIAHADGNQTIFNLHCWLLAETEVCRARGFESADPFPTHGGWEDRQWRRSDPVA
jgi:hypothetical protein